MHISRRLLILISLLIMTTTSVCAQLRSPTEPAEIRGQLRYAQGGAPANEIVVRLDQLTGGFVEEARTDRMGKFRFSNLLPVQYRLVVRHPGYKEIEKEVNLVITSSEYLQLQLTPEELPPSARTGTYKIVSANVSPEARREFEKADNVLAGDARDKLEKGMRHLENAIATDPNFLEAQLRLGGVYMDLAQWERAEHAFLRAREIDPKIPNAHFALGEIFLREKKYAEAEKSIGGGLTIDPEFWQGHFTLARVYWELAATKESESKSFLEKSYREVNETLRLNANSAGAHLLKGNLLLRAHRPTEAQKEFERYLSLEPRGEFAPKVRELVSRIKQ
jgi:tetratricopeptide (TPR) repeat protein